MGLAFAAATARVVDAAAKSGLATPLLFTIARSKNANVVRYCARVSAKGLERARPIDAFWLMLAEDGRREELSWAERQLAYGFAVSNATERACTLRLTAFDARPVQVERSADGYRALVTVAGQRALLKRIFVQTSEGALLPSVQHLDLFGTTPGGAPLSERLTAR